MTEFTIKDAMAMRFGAARPVEKPKLQLSGEDGNAYAILSRAQRALHKAGRDDEFKKFEEEATSSDYDHLLITCMKWFEVS